MRESTAVALRSWRDERVAGPLAAVWLPLSAAVAFLLGLAVVADGGRLASLATGLIGLSLGIPFLLAERREERRTFVAVWALALIIRLGVLLVIHAISVRAGGPFLGPDSTQFFRESGVLAQRALQLGAHPILVFESYDVAHYYIYAFLIGGFGADLFALQLFNSMLTALAAPLTYAVGRRLLPGYAVLLGLLVACNPSMVVLSIKDLLKDPSVLCAAAIAIWALARVATVERVSSRIAAALAGIASISYLHMDRFYVAAYLEAAAVLVALIMWRRGIHIRRATAAALLAIFVFAEIVPMSLGWRSLPGVMYEQVNYVLGTQAMRTAEPGLAERVLRAKAAIGVTGRADDDERDVGWHPHAQRSSRLIMVGLTVLSGVIGAVRRLFGPFVWMPPAHWSWREVLRGDYLLYPGTLVWYILLPFVVAGLAIVLRRGWRHADDNVLLLFLAIFCALYFAQYVVINLSFRQRDVMFPFVAVFAVAGALSVAERPMWRVAYRRYWAALAGVAVLHLTLRAVIAWL